MATLDAAATPNLVFGIGLFSGLALSAVYARDALSWYQVWRGSAPVVRSAVLDQVMFMVSFLSVGAVGGFIAILHAEKFGLTLRSGWLTALACTMVFYGSWFALRRYYARPVIKVFGVDVTRWADGSLLIPLEDAGRLRAESFVFSGATLHGLGDWRGDSKAISRIVPSVRAKLAAAAHGDAGQPVMPFFGLAAAAVGCTAPLVLLYLVRAMLF